MRQLILLACLVLAGCSGSTSGYRDDEAQIASAALFDPARFVDVWHIVAAYGPEAGCGPLAETWVPVSNGRFRVTGTRCGPDGDRSFVADARVTGPARITLERPRHREELSLQWVDGDYRVAAIGTPDGSCARVISRKVPPRPDLAAAAREALDFNGYDLGQLAGI